MGCDIHAHVEIKINDQWNYYAPVDMWRQYDVFAKMAGVRGTEDAISPPKGLPDDVSTLTRMHVDSYGFDGHSHSWLNFDEIMQLVGYFKHRNIKPWGCYFCSDGKYTLFDVYLFGNGIEGLREYPSDYPKALQDVRLVFWFDN